jgi:cell division septation protein DedD
MELEVKLKFPTEKAAAILEWLRSLPHGAAELQSRTAEAQAAPTVTEVTSDELAERERIFYSLFGAWKSEETGEELNRMLQESRYTEQRDIEL